MSCNSPRCQRAHIQFFILLITVCFCGCARHKSPHRTVEPSGGIAETVGAVAVLYLDVPAFSNLDQEDRIAAYYLAQAVLAGRDIAYDQFHPRHLEIRKFWEDIGRNVSYGAPARATASFWSSLKLLWIHNGFYNLASLKKLTLPMSDREISQLMFVALSNSGGRLGSLQDINLKRSWMADSLFNPAVDPLLYDGGKLSQADAIFSGPLQFYQGVSLSDVSSFSQQYPRNSRLSKRDTRIIEQVYRTGDEVFVAGTYAGPLEKVIAALEQARPHLRAEQVKIVDLLVQHFRTGAAADYDSARAFALQSDATVNCILGFEDTRFDPLGWKGLWTGMLFLRDEAAQAKVESIVNNAVKALDSFPANPSKNPPFNSGAIKCVQLLTAIGANGPLCPDVYFEPPSQTGSSTARSALLFTNVIAGRARFRLEMQELPLCATDAEKQQCQRHHADLAFLETTLRTLWQLRGETAIAKSDICLLEQDLDYRVLQNALGELAFLWCVGAETASSGILPDQTATVEAYRSFIRRCALAAEVTDPSADPTEIGALQLIGNYLVSKGGALELKQEGTKYSGILLDANLLRVQIGELSQEIAEILESGKQSKISAFVAQYVKAKPTEQPREQDHRKRSGRNPDRAIESDQVVREAFIFPFIKADINPMGGITAVTLERPADFAEEMLLWGEDKSMDQTK